MRARFLLLPSLIMTAMVVLGPTSWHESRAADSRPLSDFFGEFVGKSVAGSLAVSGDHAEIVPRHLNVSIQPHDRGFTLAWLTITTSGSGKTKAKSYLVDFVESDRPGVYIAAIRRNTAGKLEASDPISGEPYMWASITGDTLVVRGLTIGDDGGYMMQIYERTLTDTGMDLLFRRLENGAVMREIRGQLDRAAR